MLKVKCSVCGKILPMKDTSKTDDRILCVDCYEKLTRSTTLNPAFEDGDGKRRSGSILSKLRPSGRRVEGLTSTQEKVASEFTYQTDPTVCGRCGLDNGSNPLPTLATLPMCQPCADYLRNRPFPSWIKTSFAGFPKVGLYSFDQTLRFKVI